MLDSCRACEPRTASPAESLRDTVFGAYPGTPPRFGSLLQTCATQLPVLRARSYHPRCFLLSAAQCDSATLYRAPSPRAAASPASETSSEARPTSARSSSHTSCAALITSTTALDNRCHCSSSLSSCARPAFVRL